MKKILNRKILIEYLKSYKKAAILAPSFMVLEVIMDLFQPKLLSKIVDDGIIKGNLQLIIKTGFFMLGIGIIGLIGGIGCTIFASIASNNFGHDLRRDIFRKIQNANFRDIAKFSPSSLITRITNDVSQVQRLVLMSLRMLVRAPLLFIGGITMCFLINFKLSFILFFIIPSLLIIFNYFIRGSFNLFLTLQEKVDRLNLVVRENLSGIRIIRIFNRVPYEKERFESANQDLFNSSLKAFTFIIKMGPVVMIVINLSIIMVLLFGGILNFKNQIKVGEIIAFINYFMMILMSFMMVSNLFVFISRAGPSIERIDEILEISERKKGKFFIRPKTISGEIELKNVFFSYDGNKENSFLKDISFKLGKEKTLGIIGPTGSGKTTLLNLIAGLYFPTSGEILIDGIKIIDYEPEMLKNNIGFVTQKPIILSGTIREIMKWAKKDVSEEEIIYALKIAQIYDFVNELPDGLDTFIGQKGVNLSGGQKQRLTIARAIVRNPKILIFDDCTSSVDFITEKNIFKEIKEKLKDKTKIIVSSRIFTIMDADKILVLNKGEMAGFATHKELLETCEIYREIYETQTGEKINV